MSRRRSNGKRETSNPVIHERLRAELEQERKDLQHRLDITKGQFLTLGIANTGPADYAESDQEVLIERTSHYRQKLKMVVQSLQRLREGSFGLCASCERPIAPKRLEALPTAPYCIECQQRQEEIGDQQLASYM
jgi:RNA polymerase-binding protein DksA